MIEEEICCEECGAMLSEGEVNCTANGHSLCDNCSEYDEYNECWINSEDAVYFDRIGLLTHKDDVIMLDGKWERKNECWYDVRKRKYELINQ